MIKIGLLVSLVNHNFKSRRRTKEKTSSQFETMIKNKHNKCLEKLLYACERVRRNILLFGQDTCRVKMDI